MERKENNEMKGNYNINLSQEKEDLLKGIYEDLKIAFIHGEMHTIGLDEVTVLLDVLDVILKGE